MLVSSQIAWGGVIVNVITYYGKKFGDNKENFFNDADIFVFPTYYPNECFPLVLLEAMQHGLPCISTKEGGIPDIIQDGRTGLLVGRRNSKDLAEKIAWMIDHPTERTAMGIAGCRLYRNKFTLLAFENMFANILKKNTAK